MEQLDMEQVDMEQLDMEQLDMEQLDMEPLDMEELDMEQRDSKRRGSELSQAQKTDDVLFSEAQNKGDQKLIKLTTLCFVKLKTKGMRSSKN